MDLVDRVYGRERIDEPCLIDLINSDSIQRLKGVSQFGFPEEYYHKKCFSRYEHSVGVLVLLRKLGSCIEEQIAGLLHDVSHTAFSHVVDWVLGDPEKEDYQDKNHLFFMSNSDVPEILHKYGFDYREISNIENFSLLERESPHLCVDRVDYSVREISQEDLLLAREIVSDLTCIDNQLVFKTKGIALSFARKYLTLQREHWAGQQARARYHILSNILKDALHKEIISFEDLNRTDNYVIKLLRESGEDSILERLDLLKKGFNIIESGEGLFLPKKFRFVDPEVLLGQEVVPLTEISLEYKSLLEEERRNSSFFKKIKIIGLE